MRNEDVLKRIFLIGVASLGLGLLLGYITALEGVFYILLFSSLSGSLAFLIYFLKRRLSLFQRKEEFKSELIRAMHTMLYYRMNGTPMLKSIEKARDTCELKGLKDSLAMISRRMLLGDTAKNSINAVKELKEAFPGRSLNPNGLGLKEIRAVLGSHQLELDRRLSQFEAHSQRHATVSMFLSTILPSFVIFAFIGSTIISNTAPNMMLISIGMLIALPMVYAISYEILNRTLPIKAGLGKKEALEAARRITVEMEKGMGIGLAMRKMMDREGTSASGISLLLRRHLLGQADLKPDRFSKNAYETELEGMIAFHLNKGKSIRKSLELFCSRLENEINIENRLNAKTGGMRALTYAGLLFFLPLFGGISSSILGASLNTLNGGVRLFQQHFLMAIASYTTMILAINVTLGSPDAGLLKTLSSVVPLAIISILVLVFTAHYATEIL